MMFRGVNAINIDAKGRMALPMRYREAVLARCEGQMVVTIDTEDRCLLLYPLVDWEEIERKVESLPSFNKAARRVQRLLIGHASDVELDSNSRLLVPPELREYADLEKKVMLVGQGKKFEIWSDTAWAEHREAWLGDTEFDVDTLPEQMQSLSL